MGGVVLFVGLSTQVPYYDKALSLIVEGDLSDDSPSDSVSFAYIEKSAALLFGLIHARFILTTKGVSLAVSISVARCLSLSRCLPVSVFLYLSIYLYLYLSLSAHLCLSLSVSLSLLSLSLFIPVSLSVSRCVSLSVKVFLTLSV